MQYNVMVAGPCGSGKSCLIASAIVHAGRLAVLDLKPAQRCHGSRSHGDALASARREVVPQLTLTANSGVDLWSAQESSYLDTPAQIDALAKHLWDRWLAGDLSDRPKPAERRPALPFNVTSIASNLVGLEGFVETAQRINLIEVSSDPFETFDRSKTASRTAATQRLRHVMRGADALVICLPCTGGWSGSTRLEVRNIVHAWHELRGTEVVVALTKSDLILAERALVSRAAIDPVEAVSLQSVEAALIFDSAERAFFKSLRSVGITLQICSSYGLLRLSNTPNVDLVKPASEAAKARGAPPLWPASSLHLTELLPSVPSTLKHWMPLGAVESVFGAIPRLAPI